MKRSLAFRLETRHVCLLEAAVWREDMKTEDWEAGMIHCSSAPPPPPVSKPVSQMKRLARRKSTQTASFFFVNATKIKMSLYRNPEGEEKK